VVGGGVGGEVGGVVGGEVGGVVGGVVGAKQLAGVCRPPLRGRGLKVPHGLSGLRWRGVPSARRSGLDRLPRGYAWALVAALVAWLLISFPALLLRKACERISAETRIQTGSVTRESTFHKSTGGTIQRSPRRSARRK
jgi:hypothetical protein